MNYDLVFICLLGQKQLNITGNQNSKKSKALQKQVSPMQNNLFNTKNADRSLVQIKQIDCQTKQTLCKGAPFIESDYSQNQLNMAFIADDSLSNSVPSESLSISAISMIHHKDRLSSPHYVNCDHQISGMDQWPSENISLKQNYKRSSPSMDEEVSQEMGNSCTKKRINDRMKVVTINHFSSSVKKKKAESKHVQCKRSRVRPITQNDSNSEDAILGILNGIDNCKKQVDQTKTKLNTTDNQN